MKMAIFFFALITTINFANAAQVFKCADGARTFSIEKNSEGLFAGFYKDFSSTPKRYECEQTRAGNNYKCTLDTSTVLVRRAYSGLMMVEVDSTPNLALYCEN